MEKNKKSLVLLLMTTAVVLFTMCQPKTTALKDGSSETATTQTNNKESFASTFTDSFKILYPDVTHFYFTEKTEKTAVLAWFKYRFEIPQTDPTLSTFVVIDNSGPFQLNEGTTMISFQKIVDLNGSNPLFITVRIYTKNAAGVIISDITRTDNTICPDGNTSGNIYFGKAQVGSTVFWGRKAPVPPPAPPYSSYPTVKTQSTPPYLVITWPPTYN